MVASNLHCNIFKKTHAGDIADNFNVEGEHFDVITECGYGLPHKHFILKKIILFEYTYPSIFSLKV